MTLTEIQKVKWARLNTYERTDRDKIKNDTNNTK